MSVSSEGVSVVQQFKKIIVGVDLSRGDRFACRDLSEPTKTAVERGIWLAERLGAELKFFTSIDVDPHTEELLRQDMAERERTVVNDVEEILNELVREAERRGVRATRKVVLGVPWERTIQEVLRADHDLLIVGTREKSGTFFNFGRTSLKLLRKCPCVVWVARPDPNWDDVNVLVATDLSETAEEAMRLAINGSQLVDTRVHILHVIEPLFEKSFWWHKSSSEEIEQLRQTKREAATSILNQQLANTDYRTVKHGVQIHIEEGIPEEKILRAIGEHNIDLLVMGTSARSGLYGALLGNTAEQLLPTVPCSVIAVKPADFQCPVEPE